MRMNCRALAMTCLAFAMVGAAARTATTGAPPTHPATAGGATTSTPSPTAPPTHPAVGTSAATPEAARQQNPMMDGARSSDDLRANPRASKGNVRREGAGRGKGDAPKHSDPAWQ
jgi:hypothetical protein